MVEQGSVRVGVRKSSVPKYFDRAIHELGDSLGFAVFADSTLADGIDGRYHLW